jgi:hypothetical protein
MGSGMVAASAIDRNPLDEPNNCEDESRRYRHDGDAVCQAYDPNHYPNPASIQTPLPRDTLANQGGKDGTST